jgi:large subunit ribosomal protein L18
MIDKKEPACAAPRQTRARIAQQKARAADGVPHQPAHLRQRDLDDGGKVLASASTVEAGSARAAGNGAKGKGGNGAAKIVGKRIAEKAKAAGIEKVAFDRAGFASTAASRRWPRPRAKPA